MSTEYQGYPHGVPAPTGDDGIDLLRRLRGDEHVTFGDVADHLMDYVKQHPGTLRALDGFARFVAEVDGVEHDHDAVAGGSVTADGEPPDA